MKTKYLFKAFSLIFIMFISSLYVQAQRPQRGQQGDRMKAELELTEDQWGEIQKIREDMREEVKALMENGRNPENREKMQSIRESYKTAFEAVLTDEQQQKWETIMEDRPGMRPGMRRGQMGPRGRKMDKSEMSTFHTQMIEKRKELNAFIDPVDQKTIDDIRTMLHAAHTNMKEQRREMMENGEKERIRKVHPRKEKGFSHNGRKDILSDDDRASLESLVDKYSTDIEALMEDIKREHARGENIPEEKREMIKKRFHAHFLLMDPSRTKEGRTTTKLSAYPNPSSDQQTLSFEIKEAGTVQIDIVDRSGNIVQQVYQGYMDAGKQSIEVSLKNLNQNVYFYRVKEETQTSSLPFVIQE